MGNFLGAEFFVSGLCLIGALIAFYMAYPRKDSNTMLPVELRGLDPESIAHLYTVETLKRLLALFPDNLVLGKALIMRKASDLLINAGSVDAEEFDLQLGSGNRSTEWKGWTFKEFCPHCEMDRMVDKRHTITDKLHYHREYKCSHCERVFRKC